MTNKRAKNVVVAIYKSHTEAEAAVKELQRSGSLRRWSHQRHYP